MEQDSGAGFEALFQSTLIKSLIYFSNYTVPFFRIKVGARTSHLLSTSVFILLFSTVATIKGIKKIHNGKSVFGGSSP